MSQQNNVDIGEGLKHNTMSIDVLHYKKDYSYLIKHLLTYNYRSPLNASSTIIPDTFSSSRQYTDTFIPLFIQETICSIEQEIDLIGRNLHCMRCTQWKFDYVRHDIDGNTIYDVDSSSNDELMHSKNCLILVSLREDINMNNINRDIDDFLVVGLTVENNLCLKQQIKIANDYDNTIRKHSKVSPLYVRKIEKITSQIREFLAIKNIEFDSLSEMLYQPKSTQKTFEMKHNFNYFRNFFNTISSKYNRSQFQSIQNICLMKQGIKLLQGPPGTGKTHTLIGIVSGLYHYIKNNQENCRKHILICAPSNYAVDEIILRLMNQGIFDERGQRIIPKIVRMGVMDKNKHEDIRKVTVEYLADLEMKKQLGKNTKINPTNKLLSDLRGELEELDAKIQFLKETGKEKTGEFIEAYESRGKIVNLIIDKKAQTREEKAIYENAVEKILNEAEIICSTLNSSGSDKMDRYYHNIEAIIVDEAAQSTEPSNIIPLRFKTNKLILIGDPKQLPATTFNKQNSLSKYNRSLFEVTSS